MARSVEFKTLDWRFRHFSRPERHDPRIVLVMIDQPSLDRFEKDGVYWPWPRSIYGAILGFLEKGGARTVVFDRLFSSPSPYGEAEDAEFGRDLKKFGRTVLAMETGAAAQAGRAAAAPERFALPPRPAARGNPGGALGALEPSSDFRASAARERRFKESMRL